LEKCRQREQAMSDSDNSAHEASSSGPDGQSAGPPHLAGVAAPSLAPDADGETAKIEAAETGPKPEPEPKPKPEFKPALQRAEPRRAEAAPAAGSTALVLARPGIKAGAPRPEPAKAAQPAPSFRFGTLAAVAAMAAALGGFAGSLATAGFPYLTAPASAPINDASLTDALGRVDHQLAALKAGIEGSTRATNQQVAKIAERMDRAEKAQAEAGAKLAKAGDSIDRLDRRLAAPAPDVTGAIGESRVATETPAAADARRLPAPMLAVDGWVLRDVNRGAAMIQGRGGGIIAVLPGDVLPGLGRIEQIRREDGRWVVVTSRGLIVQR